MPTVRFLPSGKVKEVRAGVTILAAANQLGLPVGQSCSGDGICGWCRVTVLEGQQNVGQPTSLERKLMEEKDFAPQERASCLATVRGDISVTASYW